MQVYPIYTRSNIDREKAEETRERMFVTSDLLLYVNYFPLNGKLIIKRCDSLTDVYSYNMCYTAS